MIGAWALSAILLAPPTLADGLRAIGALPAEDAFVTTEIPTRVGPSVLLGVSGAALLAGVVGYLASPGCATRDAAGRCVDARGSAPVFPSLIVLGLGGLATGAWWHQRLPAELR